MNMVSVSDILQSIEFMFPGVPLQVQEFHLRLAIRRFMKEASPKVETITFPIYLGQDSYILDVGECRLVSKVISANIRHNGKTTRAGFEAKVDDRTIRLFNSELWPDGSNGSCDTKVLGHAEVEYSWYIGLKDCEVPAEILDEFYDEVMLGYQAMIYGQRGTPWYDGALAATYLKDFDERIAMQSKKRKPPLGGSSVKDKLVYDFDEMPVQLVVDAYHAAVRMVTADFRVQTEAVNINVKKGQAQYMLPLVGEIIDVHRVVFNDGDCIRDIGHKWDKDGLLELVDPMFWGECHKATESIKAYDCIQGADLGVATVEVFTTIPYGSTVEPEGVARFSEHVTEWARALLYDIPNTPYHNKDLAQRHGKRYADLLAAFSPKLITPTLPGIYGVLMEQFTGAMVQDVREAVRMALNKFLKDTTAARGFLYIGTDIGANEFFLQAPDCRVITALMSVEMKDGRNWCKVPYRVGGAMETVIVDAIIPKVQCQEQCDAVKVNACDDGCGHGMLRVEYAWTTNQSADEVPEGIMDRYHDELLTLAKVFMLEMVGKPWFSLTLAQQVAAVYMDAAKTIRARFLREHSNKVLKMRTSSPFITFGARRAGKY